MTDYAMEKVYCKLLELGRYIDRHRWDDAEEVMKEVRARFPEIMDWACRAVGRARPDFI